LFWEERTETYIADAMGINQSTINRRKRAILRSLRMRLRDRNQFLNFLHKGSAGCNLNNQHTPFAEACVPQQN